MLSANDYLNLRGYLAALKGWPPAQAQQLALAALLASR